MVTFDTSVLIFGVQKRARPEQQHLIGRAAEHIQRLRDKKTQILIPAPAYAEFLTGIPVDKRAKFLIGDLFHIAAFDVRCAKIAAMLQDDVIMRQAKQAGQVTRQCLKADVMIIATAIAYKCTSIVTTDMAHFPIIAGGRIHIQELPAYARQNNFLEDFDEYTQKRPRNRK